MRCGDTRGARPSLHNKREPSKAKTRRRDNCRRFLLLDWLAPRWTAALRRRADQALANRHDAPIGDSPLISDGMVVVVPTSNLSLRTTCFRQVSVSVSVVPPPGNRTGTAAAWSGPAFRGPLGWCSQHGGPDNNRRLTGHNNMHRPRLPLRLRSTRDGPSFDKLFGEPRQRSLASADVQLWHSPGQRTKRRSLLVTSEARPEEL